jgi:mRNA interferase RelE/StbE
MIRYESKIKKRFEKGKIPLNIFQHIHNAFIAIDHTKDLNLFDVKRLKNKDERVYFRLRKGDYRAIFYYENDDIYVIALDKREEVYKKWQ